MSTLEADKLVKQYRKKFLVKEDSPSLRRIHYTREDILRLIPHRDPFLLLDTLTGVDFEEKAIVGTRSIDTEDPVFVGHFPEHPVYPGVLQIEMIGQLAIAFYSLFLRESTRIEEIQKSVTIRVTRIKSALFQHEVLPGDNVTIAAKLVEEDDFRVQGIGQVIARDSICTLALGEFLLL